jgi:hypothetical protein
MPRLIHLRNQYATFGPVERKERQAGKLRKQSVLLSQLAGLSMSL